MKLRVLYILLLVPFIASSQNIKKLNFDQFEPYLHKDNDTVYVINFWATWCTPCKKEIPALEMITDKYKNEKVKVILVSLDFPNQFENRLIPFVRELHMKSEVILLDDTRQNEWINKVDPKWTGSIPFTQIYGKNFRESYEHPFLFNEIDNIIQNKIKHP